MHEKQAVMAARVFGKSLLQTSPDLPKGEEGLAVRDGRGRHRSWLPLMEETCGGAAVLGAPNRGLRPKVTSISARLTAAG